MLCKYYIQHYHNILVADNPPQIVILNLGMLKKSSEELTTEDKMYIIKYGMD